MEVFFAFVGVGDSVSCFDFRSAGRCFARKLGDGGTEMACADINYLTTVLVYFSDPLVAVQLCRSRLLFVVEVKLLKLSSCISTLQADGTFILTITNYVVKNLF